MATPAPNACTTRIAQRNEAAGNPRNIDTDWLEHQYCNSVPFDQQTVWFNKDDNRLYFIFYTGGDGSSSVGTSPTIEYKVLADLDVSPIEVLRTAALEQILAEIIIT